MSSEPSHHEKPKRGLNNSPKDSPCVICGEEDYEWGHPGSQGGVYYVPISSRFGFGMGEPLRARKCLHCGNIQLFLK